jgi:hypothetical protein
VVGFRASSAEFIGQGCRNYRIGGPIRHGIALQSIVHEVVTVPATAPHIVCRIHNVGSLDGFDMDIRHQQIIDIIMPVGRPLGMATILSGGIRVSREQDHVWIFRAFNICSDNHLRRPLDIVVAASTLVLTVSAVSNMDGRRAVAGWFLLNQV